MQSWFNNNRPPDHDHNHVDTREERRESVYPAFQTCPGCGGDLQNGFAQKAAGLSFVAPKSFERFISLDEDLAEAGLKKLLPSTAEYFGSAVCRACELYLIDFSRTYNQAEAKTLLE